MLQHQKIEAQVRFIQVNSHHARVAFAALAGIFVRVGLSIAHPEALGLQGVSHEIIQQKQGITEGTCQFC